MAAPRSAFRSSFPTAADAIALSARSQKQVSGTRYHKRGRKTLRDGSKGAMVEEMSSVEQKRDGNRHNKKRKEKIEKW